MAYWNGDSCQAEFWRCLRFYAITSGDGAFAVVDIDTLWINDGGQENRWLGRVCKVYSRVGDEWKMTMHTGVLEYSEFETAGIKVEA